QVGLAPRQPVDEFAHVAVDAQDGGLVPALAQGVGHLVHDLLMLGGVLALQVGENRDLHRPSLAARAPRVEPERVQTGCRTVSPRRSRGGVLAKPLGGPGAGPAWGNRGLAALRRGVGAATFRRSVAKAAPGGYEKFSTPRGGVVSWAGLPTKVSPALPLPPPL